MVNLIDGDILVWRASSSCEPTKNKPFLEPLEVALYRLHDTVQTIVKGTNTENCEFYLAGTDNFRYTIYPEYKGNRKDKPRPTWLEQCREILVTQYNASVVNNFETDDMLGIRQTQLEGNSRIVSIDKDLKQVPGWHYGWVKDEHLLVSPLDGLKTFYKQLIAGDGTDNIPSYDGKLRNSVPKFIEKLQAPIDEMTEEIDMWYHVQDVYAASCTGNQEEDYAMKDLHRNAQLIYILRKEEEYWKCPTVS